MSVQMELMLVIVLTTALTLLEVMYVAVLRDIK